jgi:hypothetical protein
MRDVYPILNETNFRGRPLRTSQGEGYLWDFDEMTGLYTVKLKNHETIQIRSEDII